MAPVPPARRALRRLLRAARLGGVNFLLAALLVQLLPPLAREPGPDLAGPGAREGSRISALDVCDGGDLAAPSAAHAWLPAATVAAPATARPAFTPVLQVLALPDGHVRPPLRPPRA